MSFRHGTENQAGVPLASLAAIVMDTETTGLDVASDRVIEIAAVPLPAAGASAREGFSTLVQPGVGIPPSSTGIHGIGDVDVADAPDFALAMKGFSEWAGSSLVLGFSIGFDLAILEAEHGRHGIAWRAPHSLDVRHLVQLAGSELPELSLDLAAEWLGLEIADRHRALADAQLAADVYQALVPRLRARGISTLGQAERACRSLTQRLDEEARVGWHSVGRPGGRDREASVLARVDSFPYRHRVADLMHAPPAIIDSEMRLARALSAMVAEQVSSLFTAPDAQGDAFGIITERDVLRAVEANGASALDAPVRDFAQRPLVTVSSEEFAYRALSKMATCGFRHLGVVGAEGQIIGALSARDLLRQRADDAVSLGVGIETAESVEVLGRVWSKLTVVARSLLDESVDARDIAAIVSRELQALTRRACELAEKELIAAGAGTAPAAYALLLLGSGGRGESLLAMDQDNAILYADPEDGADVDAWFERLGVRIADILDQVGVAYCKGGVMASNRQWRGSLSEWRAMVGAWITRSRPEDILNTDIFFDAVPVCGDAEMAEALLADARAAAKASDNFLKLLALNAADFRSPVGWFGQLKSKAGRVDLKAAGLLPLFSSARVVALRHGFRERSTPGRLRALLAQGDVAAAKIENLDAAHRILLDLILRQQLADIDDGVALSNRVDVNALGPLQKRELHWALEQIPTLVDLLGVPLIR